MKDNATLSLSPYMYETVAAGSTNQLPISSVCNASCIFCSNNMNPFPIHRIGFRPLEDVKKGIALLDPNRSAEIRLGDSLPGRISEGEALLHPDLLTILKLIRDKIPGKPIQVNTNGTILTKDFIASLLPFRPMKFTISYHSNNPEHWCRIFNFKLDKGTDKFNVATNSFSLLKEKGFAVEATIVPLPALVGYNDLENTIRALSIHTKSVFIYAPGFSRLVSPDLRAILDVDHHELSRFLRSMTQRYGVCFTFFGDPLRPLEFLPEPIMMRTCSNNFRHVLWLFSAAAFKRGKRILERYAPYVPNSHHAVQVHNRTYGGNITAAGLLTTGDFDRAIARALSKFQSQNTAIDLLLLPRVAFDRYGDDLKCCNYATLRDKYAIPIWLG